MKNLPLYCLSTLVLVGGFRSPGRAQSQQARPAYSLGTSQNLVRQLESQSAVAAAQRAAPTVALKVSASQTFTGKVNYREDLSKEGEYLVGEIQNVPGSSFLIRIEGKAVEGNIILKKTRQAYRYSADAQGNVSVQEVDINKVICIDYDKPTGLQTSSPAPTTAARTAVISLQSLPGARGCVMLDFDGQYVSGTPWNNGNPINAASPNMTTAAIQEFWELVSEDYRPFSLNITTDEAVFNTYPKNMRMRCIVTPTNTAAPGAGGVAYLRSFNWNDDTPCWVFMSAPKSGGEAASHEVGHTLGLSHDGRLSPREEYYTAQSSTGNWAPIMGAGYYKSVTQWSRGEYTSASNKEDDLAIMSGAPYNVGYRNDDHGNTTTSATALTRSGTSVSGAGVIERTTDQDFFSFTAGAGTVNLSVNTVARHGDLDIIARLYNSAGGLIGSYDATGLNTSLSATVVAGTYYVSVDGTGAGTPATGGYSDYASLGTFTISGTVPVGGGTPTVVATLYKHCGFDGTATGLAVGDYTLAALQARGVLDNDLSSVKVSSGYEVQLFDNDNFQGASIVINADNSCLVGNNWNDLATSAKVRVASGTPTVVATLYKHCDFGGTATTLVVGDYTLAALQARGVLDNDLSSVKVSSGYEVQLFDNDNFQGASIVINADNSCLVGNSWNDLATSAKVRVRAAGSTFTTTGPAGAGQSAAQSIATPQLELYPNPVADKLTIQVSANLLTTTVSIFSLDGKQVWQGSYDGQELNVAALKPGLYTVVALTKDHQKLVQRFMKQ